MGIFFNAFLGGVAICGSTLHNSKSIASRHRIAQCAGWHPRVALVRGSDRRKENVNGGGTGTLRDGMARCQASLTRNDRDCELARTAAKTYARNALDKHQMHNSAKSIPW